MGQPSERAAKLLEEFAQLPPTKLWARPYHDQTVHATMYGTPELSYQTALSSGETVRRILWCCVRLGLEIQVSEGLTAATMGVTGPVWRPHTSGFLIPNTCPKIGRAHISGVSEAVVLGYRDPESRRPYGAHYVTPAAVVRIRLFDTDDVLYEHPAYLATPFEVHDVPLRHKFKVIYDGDAEIATVNTVTEAALLAAAYQVELIDKTEGHKLAQNAIDAVRPATRALTLHRPTR